MSVGVGRIRYPQAGRSSPVHSQDGDSHFPGDDAVSRLREIFFQLNLQEIPEQEVEQTPNSFCIIGTATETGVNAWANIEGQLYLYDAFKVPLAVYT